jgi:hypothetical protein
MAKRAGVLAPGKNEALVTAVTSMTGEADEFSSRPGNAACVEERRRDGSVLGADGDGVGAEVGIVRGKRVLLTVTVETESLGPHHKAGGILDCTVRLVARETLHSDIFSHDTAVV